MTSYKDAGVDIEAGDNASKMAYAHATSTFLSRKGLIGEPVLEEDGYAGFLDMGDYYLVQSDDSTGTKIDLAYATGIFDTLGYDLLAMVCDDAVCTGAEVISVSNCLDVPHIDPAIIDNLMKGLSKACSEQKIVIPAGEIAEVPGAVSRGVWSATSIGIVGKDAVIDTGRIEAGDAIIALRSGVARSNGFSLIRNVLENQLGKNWYNQEWSGGVSWGEILLTPSVIYHNAILRLTGRYQEKRTIDVKGVAHITGGGIPSKLRRVLKKSGLGADLHTLWQPHQALTDLIELGSIDTTEAYRTWNMGNGMLVIVKPEEVDASIALVQEEGIQARLAGVVTNNQTIKITAYDDRIIEY